MTQIYKKDEKFNCRALNGLQFFFFQFIVLWKTFINSKTT